MKKPVKFTGLLKPTRVSAKLPMSPARAAAKARAGKQDAAERRIMKGGPAAPGFTTL